MSARRRAVSAPMVHHEQPDLAHSPPNPTISIPGERVRPLRDGLAVAAAIMLAACGSIALLYSRAVSAYEASTHAALRVLAESIAAQVDGDLHRTIVDPGQEATPAYEAAVAPLRRALARVAGLRFIYTIVRIDGQVRFVLDATPPGDADGDGVEDHSNVMDVYDAPDPAMLEALVAGRSGATGAVFGDAWGRTISGYAPFFDSEGVLAGVVGVDVTANDFDSWIASMRAVALSGLVPALLVSIAACLRVRWKGRLAQRAAAEGREAAERLALSERRLELALDGSGEGLWDFDIRQGSVYTDTRTLALLGRTAADAPAKPADWQALVHPDDLPRVLRRLDAHRRMPESTCEAEFRVRGRSGEWRWLLARGKAVARDANGLAVRLVGTVGDVTARRLLDNRLHRAALVIETVSEAVIVLEQTGQVVDWNHAAERVFGYPRRTAVGQPLAKLLGVPPDSALDGALRAPTGEDARWCGEARLRRADGEHVECDVALVPLLDAERRSVGQLFVARDVSERSRAERERRDQAVALARANAELREQREELRAQHVKLEQMNRKLRGTIAEAASASAAKSVFLAHMSHEIRTPITAIMGFADLIGEQLEGLFAGDLQPPDGLADCRDYAGIIRRSSDHLLQVVNDVLDLSKIEAGKLTVERVDTQLVELVDDVLRQLSIRARERGIGLGVEYAAGLPRTIQTDPVRLRQILVNVIGNAVKFTEQGSVRVAVELTHAGGRGPHVLFTVRDTGIGMSPEQLARLFRPFEQGDPTMSRRFGGTGLGLTITRSLVRRLGGEITASSKPGVGSTFTLTIEPGPLAQRQPAAACEPAKSGPDQCAPPALPSDAPLHGRVLLAEDGPDNRRLITTYLRKFGLDAEVAENGRIAVEKALAAADAGRPYDVILMDMQMPELDGYEATRRLRAAGLRVPIIALTAHAMAQDRAKCLSAGCSEYLTKPLKRAALRALLDAALSGAPAATLGDGAPAGHER
jgi:PAS domain S-box-containing protein